MKKALGVLLLLYLIVGCASVPFQKVTIPEGKSIVYFYRPPQKLGIALTPKFYDNGTEILDGLLMGTYWTYFIDLGRHEFSTKSMMTTGSFVVVNAKEAGEEIYIRMSIDDAGRGLIAKTNLYRIYPEQGEQEIPECCRPRRH
jgi:hypothetical protein